MTDPTDEELAAMEGRALDAEPGPWRWDAAQKLVWGSQGGSIASHFRGEPYGTQDGEFVAHARTDVPRLIAALRASRAENAQLRETMAFYAGSDDPLRGP